MPFNPANLAPALTHKLDAFIKNNPFQRLYEGYVWEGDTYADGFPEILKLERRLRASDMNAGVTDNDCQEVMVWGGYGHRKRASYKPNVQIALTPGSLRGVDGSTLPSLAANPDGPMLQLKANIQNMGPTYDSKVVRFVCPEDFGAIDTRIARVFGSGGQEWLSLAVGRSAGGLSISEAQAGWLAEYRRWISILRHLAHALTDAQVPINHPTAFLDEGLRKDGQWFCADVEMALFAYASKIVT